MRDGSANASGVVLRRRPLGELMAEIKKQHVNEQEGLPQPVRVEERPRLENPVDGAFERTDRRFVHPRSPTAKLTVWRMSP